MTEESIQEKPWWKRWWQKTWFRRVVMGAVAAGALGMVVVGGFLYYLLGVYLDIDFAKLPVAQGAQGKYHQVCSVDGIPYLWSYDLPYPTDFDKANRPRQSLNRTWKFKTVVYSREDLENWPKMTETDKSWRDMAVPSTYNAVGGDHVDHVGVTWYYTSFTHRWKGYDDHFTRLCFRGVLLRSQVWLNGRLLGRREGGFTPFYFDITPHLAKEGKNHLLVRVDNRLTYTSVPPLLREVNTAGWAEYGGIYRDVYLELVPRQYLFKVAYQYEPGKLSLQILSHHRTKKPSASLEAILYDPKGKKVANYATPQGGRETISADTFAWKVENPELWSPESPQLYRVLLRLEGSDTRDQVECKLGLRWVEVRGEKLFLNGRRLWLKGICKHEDHPKWGATNPKELFEKDLNLAEEMNINYFRISHYPHCTAELNAIRDRGILMSQEIPLYQAGMGWVGWLGGHGGGIRDFPYHQFGLKQLLNRDLLVNVQREIIEMIERDRNNPAIIIWGVGNECYTIQEKAGEALAWLHSIVKAFDKTRPTTYAELTYTFDIFDKRRRGGREVDIVSINSYLGWYTGSTDDLPGYLDKCRKLFGDRPLVLSEFGGGAALGRTDGDGEWTKTRFVKGVTFSEEYQKKLIMAYYRTAREKRDFVAGVSPWVLTDFYCPWFPGNPVPGYNLKGVLSRDRKRKESYWALQEEYGRLDTWGN